MKNLVGLHEGIDGLRGVKFLLDAMFFAEEAGTHRFTKEGIDLLSVSCSMILEKLEKVSKELDE